MKKAGRDARFPFNPETCEPPVHLWSAHHQSGQIQLHKGKPNLVSRRAFPADQQPTTLIWRFENHKASEIGLRPETQREARRLG
jgi:hypothetical protein